METLNPAQSINQPSLPLCLLSAGWKDPDVGREDSLLEHECGCSWCQEGWRYQLPRTVYSQTKKYRHSRLQEDWAMSTHSSQMINGLSVKISDVFIDHAVYLQEFSHATFLALFVCRMFFQCCILVSQVIGWQGWMFTNSQEIYWLWKSSLKRRICRMLIETGGRH